MSAPANSETLGKDEGERNVTALELFFDLVFVLAITQDTTFLSSNLSARGFYEGLLILALVWWSWVGYTWLTNSVDLDDGPTRVAFFVAMTGFVIVALATPEAFGKDASVFVGAYAVVRAMQVALYARGASAEEARAILGLAPGFFISVVLLLAGSIAGGDAQLVLWSAALICDIGVPLVRGTDGFQVHAGHFAERHGLIIIIALGESIVAVGGGAASENLDLALVAGACLAVAAVAAMWWAYFDIVAIVAAHRLGQAQGGERNRIARDSYSYIHFLMVAGIVILALGIKKTLANSGDPLKLIPAIALCAGPAVYLVGHVLFRRRNIRTWNRERIAASILLFALIPLAHRIDALGALAIVAGLLVVLVSYESVAHREGRARLKTQLGS